MKERNISLDVLRIIGLLCIILAHVNPPDTVFQLRNFDVPFMVVLSGILFTLSKERAPSENGLIGYIKKRFTRLVVPVWIFLTGFFLVHFFISYTSQTAFPFSTKEILGSYTLWSGIGFVWIIRVYFLVALFGPIIAAKLKKAPFKLSLLFLFYLAYEAGLSVFTTFSNPEHRAIMIPFFFDTVGYLLFFLYGVWFSSFKKIYLFVGTFILLVYLGWCEWFSFSTTQNLINLQAYKYPPHQFFFFYGVAVSSILLLLKDFFFTIRWSFVRQGINLIGSTTLWIYLWHIPFVLYFKNDSSLGFLTKYVFVLLFAITLALVQRFVVQFFLKKTHFSVRTQKTIQTIFCS